VNLAPFDAEELDVDGLALAEADALADTDALALGGANVVGVVVGLEQLVGIALPVALGVLLGALLLAVGEVVEVVLRLGLALTIGLALTVALGLLVAGLPLGLALGPVLDGLTVSAGVTLGVTDLVVFALADGEGLGGHPVHVGLGWPASALLCLAPRSVKLGGVPAPSALLAPLALLVVNPKPEPSWTTAARSGGTARAMPTANTAHAIARAGRSSPSRQSRGERRA
jgi:hypothetical protein